MRRDCLRYVDFRCSVIKYRALGEEIMSMTKKTLVIICACVLFPPTAVMAEASYEDFLGWLDEHSGAPKDGLSPGLYGRSSVPDLSRYLPPGYIENFEFDELSLELVETENYVEHAKYQAASKLFENEPKIDPSGELLNYTAGKPFSRQQIEAEKAENAGWMVAYNHIHRWQRYGYRVENKSFNVAPTKGNKKGNQIKSVMQGGGHVDRHFDMFYHRVYLSKLASEPSTNYRMKVDGSKHLLYKEYLEFKSPFDMAGMKFVIERPLDQKKGDQVNSYLPSERRVRRLSARERADSWVGTNWTLDDFEGFSGLVMDNEWRYLGKKVVLHVTNSKNRTPLSHGNLSLIPLDRWQLRPCYVVEATPRWKDHPYGRRVIFVDADTGSIATTLVYDHDGLLWKIFTTQYAHSNELESKEEAYSTPRWRGSIALNVRDNNGTIGVSTSPAEYVSVKPSQVRRLFDVSNLSSGR